MSDVLHHSQPTHSQFDAANHRKQFLARINQQAEARRAKPPKSTPLVIPIVDSSNTPPMAPPEPPGLTATEIANRIAEINLELFDLAKQNAILMRLQEFNNERPKINQIQGIVARKYGYTQADLQSERRDLKVARARHIAMYLCKQMTHHSYVKIGETFNRDHSTAMNGIGKIAAARVDDATLDSDIKHLEETILAQLRR